MSKNLGNFDIPVPTKKGKSHWVWTSLGGGHIKVNVNGSFLGNLDRGGIRETFKDSDDKVFI